MHILFNKKEVLTKNEANKAKTSRKSQSSISKVHLFTYQKSILHPIAFKMLKKEFKFECTRLTVKEW